MSLVPDGNERQLTALLIAPDHELAGQFTDTSPAACGFQILAELKAYPSEQTLAIRLRQLEPEVILLDFSTDFEQAAEVTRLAIALNPAIHVVGLHGGNNSDAILRALRRGASEFLCAPFDRESRLEALGRIRRLIEPKDPTARKPGTVIAFTSAKPGSGASTLATRLALALCRTSPDRVLLADLDPAAATAGFYLELGDCRGPSAGDPWECLITRADGLHALPAGAVGASGGAAALRELLEHARGAYDWVFIDLPAVFHRASLLALPESDRAFLVTTADLASLHLTRKALGLLVQLGFGKDRVRVLVNRLERRTGLQSPDVEKILNMPVDRSFYLERFAGGGTGIPAPSGSDLGKEIAAFAAALAALSRADRRVETEA